MRRNPGALGSDYAVTNDGTAQYIVIQTDYVDLNFPGNSNRIATYTVVPGKLMQTFQIGGRENGLDMDKFVFGTTNAALTVADLDKIPP